MKPMTEAQRALYDIAVNEEATNAFFRGLRTYQQTWFWVNAICFCVGVAVGAGIVWSLLK